MPIPTPQPGFVHLVLKDPFYLEIPIQTVSRLCLKPLKYLRFIGWCVLGVLGELVDQMGNGTNLHGTLADQGIYEYRIPHTDVAALSTSQHLRLNDPSRMGDWRSLKVTTYPNTGSATALLPYSFNDRLSTAMNSVKTNILSSPSYRSHLAHNREHRNLTNDSTASRSITVHSRMSSSFPFLQHKCYRATVQHSRLY